MIVSLSKGLAATLLLVTSQPLAAESLLKSYALDGDVKTTYWTFLASQNKYLISDKPSTMTGTMAVASPGYGAGMGLYSWTGGYSMTVNQTAPDFDIQQAVYQLDATWDPAVTFPINGGPVLSYNGGNQQIPATLPMVVDGTKVVDNNTGIPEMEGIDSFTYRGITWQWDLSAIPDVIHSVKIYMPYANHTSIVGSRIDVASEFLQVGGAPTTPLELWRQDHFKTRENTGTAADTADYDGDGLSNLTEYALGTNPTLSTGDQGIQASPAPTMTGDRLMLNFAIPAAVPTEITYKVQASSDMVNWTTLATKVGTAAWTWQGSGTTQVNTVASLDKTYIHVGDDRTTTSGSSSRVMRLQVSH